MIAASFGMSGFFATVILQQGWMYFPGREGVVSGIIIAGFGVGGYISNYLAEQWLNPYNIDPNFFDLADPSSKPFPISIANHLPTMLQNLCIYLSFISIVSLMLFNEYQKEPSKD